jgi:hypothetical protein
MRRNTRVRYCTLRGLLSFVDMVPSARHRCHSAGDSIVIVGRVKRSETRGRMPPLRPQATRTLTQGEQADTGQGPELHGDPAIRSEPRPEVPGQGLGVLPHTEPEPDQGGERGRFDGGQRRLDDSCGL